MVFIFQRTYRGPLQGVILDWAGTTVDYGSFAPTAVFLRLFETRGVGITPAQARAGMGLMKKDHLRSIFAQPGVARAWQDAAGRPHTEADIDALFADFVPLQLECLSDYAEPIPGCVEAIREVRARGLKVGSTTGYIRSMMDILMPEARRRGYSPDACVCPDEVPAGRPYPWMCFQNAILLQAAPLESLVKVGDTLVDIEEGLNAGMWTVGLALTGNLMGLSEADVNALPAGELQARRKAIGASLYQAGAHYVVDSIADLPFILDQIEDRLRRGERP